MHGCDRPGRLPERRHQEHRQRTAAAQALGRGNSREGQISMKTIPLSRGFTAVVDDDDYERLARYKGSASKGPRSGIYAIRERQVGEEHARVRILLHLEILSPAPGLFVDHINGDT